MRQPMVAGNWKMNCTRWEAEHLAQAIKDAEPDPALVEVVLCPPYTVIDAVSRILKGAAIRFGAQNLFWEKSGAYTGEVSGEMLRDLGCRYVIIGHSERRQHFGETDETVVKKFVAARRAGLVPIVCVGETERERRENQTETVIGQQVDALLQGLEVGMLQGCVMAYEPVWAIGTGLTASPEQAQDVHAFIRKRLAALDDGLAHGTRILYGGSVKANNAATLLGMPDIDGGLVGGASLNASEFLQICRAVTG